MQWLCRNKILELHQPPLKAAIMGIVNLTPDSFSDGGWLSNVDDALARVIELAETGCAVVDIGGQSTRPGHVPVSPEEEWQRIEPLLTRIDSLRREGVFLPFVSVDTYQPEVARKALAAGVDIINDVHGFENPAMRAVAAEYQAGCVVMHSEDITKHPNPISAVRKFFEYRVEQMLQEGIRRESICLDCGIGFGKTREQEAKILEHMGECRVQSLPLLAAASRKRIIAYLMGRDVPPDQRDPETHCAHLTAVQAGADMVRVHDAAGARKSLENSKI